MSRQAAFLFPFLICVAPFAVRSSAVADWTRFRGPNGTGVVEQGSIPTTWSNDDYSWRTKLPGAGYGSPVVIGNSIFLLASNEETAQRSMVSLDLKTGRQLWQRDFASQPHRLHAKNSYASGTPCCDEQAVYATWADYQHTRVVAFKHDGTSLWDIDLGTWIGDHGFAASPMLYEDLVVLMQEQQADELKPGEKPGQSRMVALNKRTGEIVWTTLLKTTRPCYGTPSVYAPSGKEPLIIDTNTGDGLFAIDPKTGKMQWSLAVFKARCCSSPVIAGDFLIGTSGSGGGGNHLVAVRPSDTPEEVYRVEKQAPYVPTPVYRNGLLFCVADRGVASCLDASNGEEIWTERLGGNFYSSPIIVGDRLLCVGLEGKAHVLRATRQGGVLGEVNLGETCEATPAFSQGFLLLRFGRELCSINCTSSL